MNENVAYLGKWDLFEMVDIFEYVMLVMANKNTNKLLKCLIRIFKKQEQKKTLTSGLLN